MKKKIKKILLLALVALFVSCENGFDDGSNEQPYVYDAQPRYLTAYDGKVYATYYDGYVARIDTATLEVEAVVKVGRNPEQLSVYNGCLYVANSGGMDYNTEIGYDKTVSVVDIASFTETKKIEVVCNPAVVVSCDDGVFVGSYGNYDNISSTLQYVDVSGGVSVVNVCPNMTEMCYIGESLYGFFSEYDEYWNATYSFMCYNKSSGEVDSPWIKEEFLPTPYKVCAAGDTICVTSSDYINNGDTYLYNTDGKLVKTIPSGLNPVKAVVSSNVCYVLNSGDSKNSNSSLTMCDLTTGDVEQNYFKLQNGRSLGNTANDIIVYGSKMYIAVSGESTIEVVSLDVSSIKQIECKVQSGL